MSNFQIPFIKNKDLIANGDKGVINISLPDPALAPTLVNQPFPRKTITFLEINASVAGSMDLEFKTIRGDVGFKGSANAQAMVSVFPNPQDASAAVAIDPDVPLGLNLPGDAAGAPPTHYDVIRWGFDANASISGKVALGASGAVTFGATGTADAISAVVRRFDDGALFGKDELIGTAGNWRLPSQIDNADSLDPRTWIVAEVEGSLELNLGAQYGLNYNWVRSLKLGGLTGDIGLKLQLGVSAALGFNVAGKYVVVVSRETADPVMRVQVFKLARNGFDFAFDAGVSAQADTSALTPDKADDFIQAVLGVHGAQVIDDLHAIEAWTGSQQSLSGLLAQAGNDYVIKLVKNLTGFDVIAQADKLTQAKTQILSFIDKWTSLSQINHYVATRLLKFVEQKIDLTPIKQAAGILANGDAAQLSSFVAGEIGKVGFPQTPLAQFLESAAGGGILSLLQKGPAFTSAQEVAAAVQGLLDGSIIEQTLSSFEQNVEQGLGITDLIAKVKDGLSMADFQSLDKLLQAKLAALIDKTLNNIGLGDLDTIRKAIGTFLGKRQEIYQNAVKALNQVYKAEFTATYERTSTSTALLDIQFDFARDNGTFSTLLKSVIDGKFAGIAANGATVNLLVDEIPGITLRQAALTHDIVRHSHQELHLPYFLNVSDHVNSGKASFVVNDSKRVIMSEGKDLVSDSSEFHKNKNRRDSTLSVLVQFGVGKAGEINVHDTTGLSFSYQLRQATANTTDEALTRQVQPYTGSFFGPLFGAGNTRLSLADLIRVIDQAAGGRSNRLGTTLVSLDLTTPPAFGSAWFLPQGLPGDEDARLARMSRAIQTAMRRIVAYVHFQDPARFDLSPVTSAYLVYAACPPIAQKNFNFFFPFFPFSDLRDTMLGPPPGEGSVTGANLQNIIQAISTILANTPGADPSNFQPSALNRILRDALTNNTTQQDWSGFIGMESSIISTAIKARKDLQGFQANLATKPDKAIASLADFSANLVDAFNKNVGDFSEGSDAAGIRSLGTLVFLEACLALQGSDDPALLPNAFTATASGQAVVTAGVEALLQISVLKPTATVPDNFFVGEDPAHTDTVIETRLFNQLLVAAGAANR